MIIVLTKTAKFALGSVYATANAVATFPNETLIECLNRHASGDWGDLEEEDRRANEDALLHGSRLLSSYVVPGKGKLWAITEHDRSATTLLLPEDY